MIDKLVKCARMNYPKMAQHPTFNKHHFRLSTRGLMKDGNDKKQRNENKNYDDNDECLIYSSIAVQVHSIRSTRAFNERMCSSGALLNQIILSSI